MFIFTSIFSKGFLHFCTFIAFTSVAAEFGREGVTDPRGKRPCSAVRVFELRLQVTGDSVLNSVAVCVGMGAILVRLSLLWGSLYVRNNDMLAIRRYGCREFGRIPRLSGILLTVYTDTLLILAQLYNVIYGADKHLALPRFKIRTVRKAFVLTS